jgi:hypothetical protein
MKSRQRVLLCLDSLGAGDQQAVRPINACNGDVTTVIEGRQTRLSKVWGKPPACSANVKVRASALLARHLGTHKAPHPFARWDRLGARIPRSRNSPSMGTQAPQALAKGRLSCSWRGCSRACRDHHPCAYLRSRTVDGQPVHRNPYSALVRRSRGPIEL